MALFFAQKGIPDFEKAVVTIGSFDGVHQGHLRILKRVVEEAQRIDGGSVVVTFEPHPRKVIRPDVPIQLISSPEQKYSYLQACGIDHIVVVPFTREFSLMDAASYVSDFLMKILKPHTIIIGYDHQFGHDRKGDIHLLRTLLPPAVSVIEIPEHLIEDAHVSSTRIRQALLSGDVATARQMLGRPFSFSGIVVHGRKLGRTLGYPTANIKPGYDDQLLPPSGIYAVRVHLGAQRYLGAMSIGTNPTVVDQERATYEVFILDFDQEIYGLEIEVHFIERLRDELKFDHLDALKEQMALDVAQVRVCFRQEQASQSK